MFRKSLTVGALALLVSLGATRAFAQNNPNGFIQSQGWTMLVPLLNPFASAPPVDILDANWVAPHDLTMEDPRAGDVWDDIDFGGASPATGYDSGGLAADPTWVTVDLLEALFPNSTFNRQDTVNYQDILVALDAEAPGTVPNDNVSGIALTYVENTTGAPLEIQVCSGSDDSPRIDLNNVTVFRQSIGRGSAACQETNPAILPPGVSKIVFQTWEGTGGFNFLCQLQLADGTVCNDANSGDTGVVFLGPGEEGDGLTGQPGLSPFLATRTVKGLDGNNCAPSGPNTVTIQGNGGGLGSDDDMLTVVESFSVPAAGPLDITNISNGGVFEDTSSADSISEADPDYRPGVGDTVPNPGMPVQTAACGNCDTLNPGGVPTWNEHNGANYDYNPDYYGGDVNDAMMYNAFYMCLDTDTDVFFGTGSDDSWSIRVDGEILASLSIPRGCGGADTSLEVTGPFTLSAGKHFVLYKIYEGGGGHCGRLGIFSDAAGTTPLEGATYGIDPAGDTCEGGTVNAAGYVEKYLFLGPLVNPGGAGPTTAYLESDHLAAATTATITWNVTRGELNAGISYDSEGAAAASVTGTAGGLSLGGNTIQPGTSFVGSGPLGIFDNAQTIGNATIGETTHDADTDVYTMTSNGSDIWTGGDHMQFAYKKVTGDFVATARIVSRTEPESGGQWGKHGIMARQSCDVASRFDMIQTSLTSPGNNVEGPRFAKRLVHLDQGNMDEIGGFTSDPNSIPDGAIQGYDPAADPLVNRRPEHMMMVRNGTWISSYVAFDDGEGNPLGWFYFMRDNDPVRPDDLLVGMALTSHTGDDGPPGTIEFTFDIEQPSSGGASPADMVASRDFESDDDLGIGVDNGNFTPAIVDGRLRVAADAIGDQAQAMYYGVPSTGDGGAPLLADGFAAEFDAYLSKEGGCEGADPADGMTFVVVGTGASDGLASALAPLPGLEVDTLLGGAGGSLAYAGGAFSDTERQRGHPHFAVEIDTWVGGGDNEPADGGRTDGGTTSCNWHIGLDEFGSVTSLQTNVDFGVPTGAMPDIWAPEGVHVEVVYQATGQVDVFVSANDGSSGRVHALSRKILPLGAQDVVLGFTGATGGANANYEVDNFVVSTLCEEDGVDSVSIDACPAEAVEIGSNVTLSATAGGADGAVTYAWSVSGGTIVGAADGSSVEIACDTAGTVTATVTTTDGACDNETSTSCSYECATSGVPMIPGDANLDGDVNITDPIAGLNDLFTPVKLPACLSRDGVLTAQGLAIVDWNGDGSFNITDPIAGLNFLFAQDFPDHVLGGDCVAIEAEGDCEESCTIP